MRRLSPLHIQRFEMKYYVPEALGAQFIQDSLIWTDPDRYVDPVSGYYPVYSLYFDTPTLRYYHEKKEGCMVRKKVRLRTYHYPFSPSHTVFGEIKKKHDTIIIKDRFSLHTPALRSFFKDGLLESIACVASEQTIHFLTTITTEQLTPYTAVLYERTARIGRCNQPVRLTLDCNLRGAATQTFDQFLHTSRMVWQAICPGFAILEIKYTDTLPAWLHDLIVRYNLTRTAYSKYCASVESVLSDFPSHAY